MNPLPSRIVDENESNNAFVSSILRIEVESLKIPRGVRAAYFRKMLYRSDEYRRKMGKIKAGSSAVNWRKTRSSKGDFICPSLKMAWTIYQKLGKQDWYETGEKGKRKEVPDEIRCVAVTAAGKRCSRKIALGRCYCTQHC